MSAFFRCSWFKPPVAGVQKNRTPLMTLGDASTLTIPSLLTAFPLFVFRSLLGHWASKCLLPCFTVVQRAHQTCARASFQAPIRQWGQTFRLHPSPSMPMGDLQRPTSFAATELQPATISLPHIQFGPMTTIFSVLFRYLLCYWVSKATLLLCFSHQMRHELPDDRRCRALR